MAHPLANGRRLGLSSDLSAVILREAAHSENRKEINMLSRFIAFLYGLVCYLVFLVAFLYAIAFVGNIGLVRKTIDSGPPAPLTKALIINAILMSLFSVLLYVMAQQLVLL